jgi:hypothetical protein
MHHHERAVAILLPVVLFGAESGEMIAARNSLVNDEIQASSTRSSSHCIGRTASSELWLAHGRGYRLEVAYGCHVVFERWVVPSDAAIDMALLARWN